MRARHEVGEIRGVERVVERQHRHAVAQFGEAGLRRAADPVRWRIGADQCGKPRLDRGVAPAQRVILGVGDLRRVALVIGAVVMRDLGGQTLQFRAGFGFRQVLDRFHVGLRCLHDQGAGCGVG